MAKDNSNRLKQNSSLYQGSFDSDLSSLDSYLDQNDHSDLNASLIQDIPILSDVIETPEIIDEVLNDARDFPQKNMTSPLTEDIMSSIALGSDEAKKLALQAMDKMHKVSPTKAQSSSIASSSKLQEQLAKKTQQALMSRNPSSATSSASSSASEIGQEDDQYNYKLQALTREIREDAETVLQDVLDEFVPHIESELHKRLNKKIDAFISQTLKSKSQKR